MEVHNLWVIIKSNIVKNCSKFTIRQSKQLRSAKSYKLRRNKSIKSALT